MGIDELAVVMECFGRALVLEPFLATVVLGGGLLAAAGTPEQKAAILPRVATGETFLALAWTEPGSRWSRTEVATTASPDGDSWRLDGQKIAVLGGDVADQLVVTARMPDGGVGLFLVDGSAVARDSYRMQDALGGADVLLSAAGAEPVGSAPAQAAQHIESVLDTALAALCAEAVGAMDRMLWMTVDYLKTRHQFGQPIAVFQTLQHRAANMYVALEQARSMALLARIALADEDVTERRRAVRAAKVQVDLAARHIGQEAVQLHGGIGMTMEYPVGHYLKRLTMITRTFADTDTLVASVGEGPGLITEH
ncbi:MAG: acyl-CoA dehydrogenase family protein, partial [Mycobacterium sp.]|nr:acyl-CoA dehydrogenase family protein [Mycobacterium sp.]